MVQKLSVKLLFCIVIAVFLFGCGGGGGNNSTNDMSSQTTNTDPRTNEQWYIDKLGLRNITGQILNQTYIQIVDTGFKASHEDLAENFDAMHSWNFSTLTNDPTPTDIDYNENGHGTKVAGIIGARGFNAVGIRGIAPYAKISGYNYRESYPDKNPITNDDLRKAWLTGNGANEILVSNNSWGGPTICGGEEEVILKEATQTLRDGKGRIFVFAAGNYRKIHNGNLSANGSCLLNNPYVITVASVDSKDTVAETSSWGSNILVSAYGVDILSTEVYQGEDSYFPFSGTSFAAPIVSGVIGLLLESCPSLTYRDVKYLIATTSNRIDTTNPTWVKNSANLWHSIDYGYGLIDLPEMLRLCQNNYQNLPAQQEVLSEKFVTSSTIPDGNSFNLSFNIPSSGVSKVEWVGVDVNFTHDDTGEIEIFLTSPHGTKTTLMKDLPSLDVVDTKKTRYASHAFYDENPTGNWILEIKDIKNNTKHGTLDSAQIHIIGH